MYQQLFKAVDQSATVLTGSARLARSLLEQYSTYQRDRGRAVWTTPVILQWNAFLAQCWREGLLNGAGRSLVLINPAQEAAIWETIVRELPEGRGLLRIPETARKAMDAWDLMHAYRLPFSEAAFTVSEDCEAFYRWAAEFQVRCEANHWLEPARLSEFAAALLRTGQIERPFPVYLAGIDDITPRQQDLLDALCGAAPSPQPDRPARPRIAAFPDAATEMREAAAWARTLLARNPSTSIGVVVPNLEGLRAKAARLFGEQLAPEAFHISLGPRLFDHPLVRAAFDVLERSDKLLLSPFIKGAATEQSGRALLDAARRDRNRRQPQEGYPIWAKVESALDRETKKLPPEQYASDWSRAFSRLLKIAGWPGDRTLSSEEYQVLEAWNGLLSTFATLDAVTGRLTCDHALARLKPLAQSASFQPENRGAPVEVMGLLEASGLRFDHLWVMGLHDEAMPPPARPHPFLPLGLQRQHGLPHCSPARELDFNTKLLARLTASAPSVILSYPQWDGDQQLNPSSLLTGEPAALHFEAPSWAKLIQASSATESLEDATAPALPEGHAQRGGTSILKDVAACPFRAYARHRLGARELEDPDLGINARDHGTIVHKALQFIWTKLRDQATLRSLDPAALAELIAEASRADDRFVSSANSPGFSLEKIRLTRLLHDWLALEAARPSFTVLDAELKTSINLGGLCLETRIDRIDQLPDGTRLIIDYKTSVTKGDVWLGDRMDEPQVPLYCIGSTHPIAGAALAQLRTGEVHFRGVSDNAAFGPMKEMRCEKGARLADLTEEWRAALDGLATNFRNGAAPVDPKQKSTCDYCELPALCRLRDVND